MPRHYESITEKCTKCLKEHDLLPRSLKKNKAKHDGNYVCHECVGRKLGPLNKPSGWTEEKRKVHGEKVKKSEAYQKALLNVDRSGEKNGMFGKKASDATKAKMSKSRKGRIGPKAPAWKGGKCSLNVRLKSLIHGTHNWYYKVYKRDGWKCVDCGSKKKLDAHHIKPISKIIKELLSMVVFENDEERLEWLIEQPEIKDEKLTNGVTVCRECHKKRHNRWGSHDAETKEN